MSQRTRGILFLLFFVSGFSSLVYQVVWTRMAFASFGIITPVLSVVLSVFMLGLAIGSWAGGRWIPALTARTGKSAIFFYAGAELLIGLGAFMVPKLFAVGEQLLLGSGEANSFQYLLLSAVVLAATLLPWCFCMGMTFPFMMAYVRERENQNTQSFSYLYLANVLGAMSGTFMTAMVLVEIFGFHQTLQVAATGNCFIALLAGWMSLRLRGRMAANPAENAGLPVLVPPPQLDEPRSRLIRWILFFTGFCAMAMEVVWTRAFAPVLKTEVYSFALIVFFYLGATFLGSLWYRHDLKKKTPKSTPVLMCLLVIVSLLPAVATDPRLVRMDSDYYLHALGSFTVLLSIFPFCAFLGYLTPGLIDEYAAGHPTVAGRAYAINVLGCILGPLFASYILLPRFDEHSALILLALPFFGFFLAGWKSLRGWQQLASSFLAVSIAIFTAFFSHGFSDQVSAKVGNVQVRRDYAASVISGGSGMKKILLVNGIGMTTLTPITKFMVHLPMAFHAGKPESVLVICFGMGTSYGSALSWGAKTIVVELIPDVPKTYGFYHDNAGQVLNDPNGRIVIDDGRRFLKRTSEKYDVIVVDPPPPVEQAGCSLLYSTEFYDLVKKHLKPGGILQAWYPTGDKATAEGYFGSLNKSFPYVRCFPSLAGWGIHSLASMTPIQTPTADELAARLPAGAKKDLLEWNSPDEVTSFWRNVITNEVPIAKLLNVDPDFQITDDDPLNEYFILRRAGLL